MTDSGIANPPGSRFRAVRIVHARPRLFGCLLLAVLIGFLQPSDWRSVTRLLIAWNAGVWTYLALASAMMFRAGHDTVRQRAAQQDEGRFVLLVLACFSAIASVGAIVAQLAIVKNLAGTPKLLHIGLATSTIISAWMFIHLIFALHYAHEFFLERRTQSDVSPERRGGLAFPGVASPDYWDFLYFSYVIGVASQTADVAITSRPMRHVALAHCILAFFFNTTILALTINIAAGLF